jgi:phage major head subunit gpT-like protein
MGSEQVFRVFEVFMEFLYPEVAVRVPSTTTIETWRSMMPTVVKWVAITAAIQAHHAHSISDETTVGGVSIEGVGLRLCDGNGRA